MQISMSRYEQLQEIRSTVPSENTDARARELGPNQEYASV